MVLHELKINGCIRDKKMCFTCWKGDCSFLNGYLWFGNGKPIFGGACNGRDVVRGGKVALKAEWGFKGSEIFQIVYVTTVYRK